MTDRLFDRRYRLSIGELNVTDLRAQFRVEKHLKPEPNKVEIKVYNLQESSRRYLENIPERPKTATLQRLLGDLASPRVVRLEAGYADGQSLIYVGEVRAATSQTMVSDVVTTVTSGDGEKDQAVQRINVPVGPGQPIELAMRAIVGALGLGEGNLATVLPALKLSGAAKMSVMGTVLSGNAWDELVSLCRAADLEPSIQNGKLQIVNRGKPLAGLAFLLSSNTGLIESPSVDSKGIVTFKVEMIPDLYPGRFVVFDSKHIKGGYRVDECVYSGDTHGNEWGIECKASRIKPAGPTK